MARLKEIWILQTKLKAMKGQERTDDYKIHFRRLRRLMLAELKRENRHEASRRRANHPLRVSPNARDGGSPDARSAV